MENTKIRLSDLVFTFQEDNQIFVRSNTDGIGISGPSEIVEVLSFFDSPKTRTDFENQFGEDMGYLYDDLVDAGMIVSPTLDKEDPVFFGFFSGLDVHRSMLSDHIRLGKYRAAIEACVQPGDVVIDAGAGTGVLSIYAAKSGAKKVYAIENSEMGQVIMALAKENGVDHIIEVVRGNFGEVELPEKADVLVTETFGFWVIDEGALPELKRCADRNLKPHGIAIPNSFSLYLSPVNRELNNLTAPFENRPDGLKMESLLQEAKTQSSVNTLSAEDVEDEIKIGTYPILNNLETPIEEEVTIPGPAKAICAHFVLHLCDNIDLSNSPKLPKTSWSQASLPIHLSNSQNQLKLSIELAEENRRSIIMQIKGDVNQKLYIS